MREESPATERNMKSVEEKARDMELREEDTQMAEAGSMETEPEKVEQREVECVSCGNWMKAEKEEEFFVMKDRCKGCKGRICERCIPLANRIN